VGADPAGAAATAQANAVLAANAYTDASILAVTTGSGRAKIASTVTVPNLSAVALNTLDPSVIPVTGDKVLLLGSASPDGVIPVTPAYGGLYDVGVVVAGVAPFTRNANYNTAAEICGASWFVTNGVYSNDFWACTNDVATTTLNVTPLTFVQFAGALSNNAAQPLGVASAGTSHDVSRADHVHVLPSAGDVGAAPATRSVNTTAPLSGGGTLSSDLTLSLTLASGSGLEDSSGLRISTSAAGTGLTGGGGSALAVSFGSSAGTACEGNDSRLSNARTPTSHAASHGSAGTDPVTIAATQVTGLGNSATRNVGTGAGDVAAGDAPAAAAAAAVAGVTTTSIGAVPTPRTINTTSPLSGGGALTADLTLSVATATTLAAGVVQLSSATPQALGVAAAGSTGDASDAGHVHAMPTAADVGAPPTSRTVATTSPLSGGGTLSGDLNLSLTLATGSGLEDSSGLRISTSAAGTGLTGGGGSALAVSFGSTSTTACVGNDARLSDARTPTSHAASHGSAGSDPITIASTQVTGLGTASGLSVGTTAGTVAAGDDSRIVNAVPNTRQIIAGTGLTGGGDLTANRTLSVSYGTTAGTAAQGNDLRITSAVPSSRIFGGLDLSADRTADNVRVALNLGAAALLNVGTTAGTVAAGDDSRIVNAVPNTRTVAGLALSSDISVAALNTALGSNSSLGVRTLIADTGWTNTTSGTASITRVAGVHTFNVNANGFAIERRATISTAECPAIEVLGRINVTTGTPASGWYSSISLANTADTFGFLAQVHESQKLGLYQNNGAGWTQVALSAGIFSLGSGIWIRLVVTPSYASCGWLATGTNTPPPAGSEWNLGGTVATTIGTLAQSYLNQVGVRSGRPNTGSGTYTTEWTQLQWRILGVSP
jgi:hypothetical protein